MGNYNEAARVSGVSREAFPSHKIEIFESDMNKIEDFVR